MAEHDRIQEVAGPVHEVDDAVSGHRLPVGVAGVPLRRGPDARGHGDDGQGRQDALAQHADDIFFTARADGDYIAFRQAGFLPDLR